MKNILSENMLRFGVKNLSESNKKRLTLESILQTINEHGLVEEVKLALSETETAELTTGTPEDQEGFTVGTRYGIAPSQSGSGDIFYMKAPDGKMYGTTIRMGKLYLSAVEKKFIPNLEAAGILTLKDDADTLRIANIITGLFKKAMKANSDYKTS